MSHIFVSHASLDDELVTPIHDEVEAATGLNLWVDHKDIVPAENYRDRLHAALRECSAGLLVLSRRSVGRPEIDSEWNYILSMERPLYIVKIDDVPLADINPRLSIIQWIDLTRDRAAGIAALVAALTGGDVPAGAPIILSRRITGDMPARLTRIPMRGRDDDLRRVIDALSGSIVQITGTGGLGKSRLAAEVVLQHGGIDGAIWHTVSDVSRADSIAELLRSHYDLPAETEWRDLLKHVKARGRLLVVVDNGESASPDARAAYVKFMRDLEAANVGVLLTSRNAWDELDDEREIHPSRIDSDPAAQIVRDMAAAILPEDRQGEIDAQADAIAEAARRHPELIEVAIKQMKKLPLEQVLANLREFSGRKIDEALDEMLGVSLRQMTDEAGGAPAWALNRLNVTRGGFTYTAAQAIALVAAPTPADADIGTRNGVSGPEVAPTAITHESDLQDALAALVSWSFLIFDGRRYTVDALAAEYVGEDESAHRPHYDFYLALAEEHDERQDYLGLDVESANLEAAFEWAMREDTEDAYWLANAASNLLFNRGRFTQILSWDERIVATLDANTNQTFWANAQISLGVDLMSLPIGDRRENLRRAVTAYEEALRFHTPEAAPLDYAMTQNNLGTAYSDLAALEDRAGNLRQAVAAYEQALRFYTPEAAPLAYATTQNNLGNAYRDLAALEDRAGNLRQAVDAFEQALRFRTPETAPLAYATTQNNLGYAYANLAGVEDRAANLQRAVTAYEQALRFRTPEAAPLDYAMTQRNLGIAHEDLGDLPAAVACWREAERYYRQMGAVEDADLMLRWIADAEGGEDEGEETPPDAG